MKAARWLLLLGLMFIGCLVCVAVLLLARRIVPVVATPSPAVNVSTLIAQTADLASTQTAIAAPTLPPLQPVVCSCVEDILGCDDFTTQADAQACLSGCLAQGAGDIHNLDANEDGLACEDLP